VQNDTGSGLQPQPAQLTSRRIEKAKRLLAKPALSVTRVAFDLGFSELSSFTSTFHKLVGVTPTDYRRSL
jgi:AraC family transcriptional regulator